MDKRLAISGVHLLSIGRILKAGTANFAASVNQDINSKEIGLAEVLEVDIENFPDNSPSAKFDGDFTLNSFEMVPQDKNQRQYTMTGETSINGARLNDFQIVRRELKGKKGGAKGNGFRFEFRWKMSFTDIFGIQKLNTFWNGVGDFPFKMTATYTRQAVQEILTGTNDGTAVDMKTGEVQVSAEEAQGVLDASLTVDVDDDIPTEEGPGMTPAQKKQERLNEEAKKKALRKEAGVPIPAQTKNTKKK